MTEPIKNPSEILDARDKDVRRVQITSFSLIALLIIVSGFWIHDLASARDYWRSAANEAQQDQSELVKEYTSLYDEFVEETGRTPFADDPSEVGSGTTSPDPDSLRGPEGPPGPPGPRGVRGEPGKNASMEQAIQALAMFCAGDACVGPAGAPGSPGADGRDGLNADYGIIEQMVRDAVVSYCNANNNCVGPRGATGPSGSTGAPGPTGATGPSGAPGVGVQSVTCSPNGEFLVTYTNGLTDVAGYCFPENPNPEEPPAGGNLDEVG